MKSTSQTATLSCSDNVGVSGYYWGTSAPTSTSLYSLADNNTSFSVTKTVSTARTYYFACKDAAGNISDAKSIVYNSYVVNNMLQNVTGSTYTTTDYTSKSSATYIAPKDTTITLTSVYTIPDYSRSGRFNGYSSGTASTTAATPSKTNPTITANTTYTMWFTRNVIHFRYKVRSGESFSAGGNTTYTWSLDADNYIVRTSEGKSTINIGSYRYGLTETDLVDNYNLGHFNIVKPGYAPNRGKEWICISGCKSTTQTFNQAASTSVDFDSICSANLKTSDCNIDLGVNWVADNTNPTANIEVTDKSTSGKATFKITCSDANGVDAYYFGTTDPSSGSVSYTNIGKNTSYEATITKEGLSSPVTHYLACRDMAQNKTTVYKTLSWSRDSSCGTEYYANGNYNCACGTYSCNGSCKKYKFYGYCQYYNERQFEETKYFTSLDSCKEYGWDNYGTCGGSGSYDFDCTCSEYNKVDCYNCACYSSRYKYCWH